MRAALLAVLILAGCSSKHLDVGVNTSTRTSTSGGSLQVQASNRAALAIIIISLLGASASEFDRPLPDPRSLLPGNTEPVPPLAPDRKVSEQDCSKPVDWSAGNIRCK